MPHKPQPVVLALLVLGSCTAKGSTDAATASAAVQPGGATAGISAPDAAGRQQPATGSAGRATAQARSGEAGISGTMAIAERSGSNAPRGGMIGQPTGGMNQTPKSGSHSDAAVADGGTRNADSADASTSDASMTDDLCGIGVSTGQQPIRPQLSGNTGAHDPTMIEADGKYYRFWTGDNTLSAASSDLSSWSNAPAVYRDGYPQWSRDWLASIQGQTFNFPWAPDASFFGGKYHLYVSFSAKFGDNISCITHLTTTDVASGNWKDHGPVICTTGDEKYNAIDPDVGFDTSGKPYLAFGSFWDGIMSFPLTDEGERIGADLTRLAWANEIEAPVLFRRCGWYYLFVSHGLCCPGTNRTVDQLTYRIAVGRSKNILGPYVDRQEKKLIDGGGTVLVMGDSNYAAAGHSDVLVSRGHIYQLYHAYKRPRGDAELRIVEMLFDADGWPLPNAP